MEVGSDLGFLFEAEMDDDVFYAEIRRWIMQLTTEDEEDNDLRILGETKRVNNNGNNLTVSGGGGPLYGSAYGFGSGLLGGSYFWSWEAQNSGGGPPPIWLMNLWNKNGKGTWVFIPQAVRCKKNARAEVNLSDGAVKERIMGHQFVAKVVSAKFFLSRTESVPHKYSSLH